VVRPADEADPKGAAVLLREVRVDVTRAFRGLDEREAGPRGGDRGPVDVPLPAAHVVPGQPCRPEPRDGAEVALREPCPGVVELRVCDGAALAGRRPGRHDGNERDHREC
jgi:hypothetical protein